MIEVNAHPNRTVFFENLAELRRDPLRQKHGDARADPDKLHMFDRAQPRQKVLELLVREQQGITAREQYVAHLGVGLNVTQALLIFGMKVVVLRVGHQTAPRAIAAVGRTAVRHEKEHAIRIPMHQPRHRRVSVLSERIEALLLADHHLTRAGNDLLANRAVGIVTVDQVEKIRGDRERQLLVCKGAASLLVGGERHELLELGHRRNTILQLPNPITPVTRGNVLPESLAFEPSSAVFSVGHRFSGQLGS